MVFSVTVATVVYVLVSVMVISVKVALFVAVDAGSGAVLFGCSTKPVVVYVETAVVVVT